MTPRTGAGTPRLRADAARNRIAILAAAEEIFAAEGQGLSTEAVAKRAGVGIGTIFRHFPTKRDLLQALLVARMTRLTAEADALALDDRGEALFVFFERLVAHAVRKRALAEALTAVGVDVKQLMQTAGEPFRAAVARLLARAQQQGVVRNDVGVGDVLPLILALAQAADQHAWDKRTQRRALKVLFDGLRRQKRSR